MRGVLIYIERTVVQDMADLTDDIRGIAGQQTRQSSSALVSLAMICGNGNVCFWHQ
jgi:hypothetical protein